MNNKEPNRFETEINILPLLRAILSKWWLILLVGIVFAGASYTAAKLLIKPTYRCSFTAYVNNQHDLAENKGSLTYSDINAAVKLTQTYSYIIRSNAVLSAAAEAMGTDLKYGTLKNKVSTELQNETEIISVYVTDTDPQFAYDLASAITVVAPTLMTEIIEGSSMKIIDMPTMPTYRYGPSYLRYALFGGLLGAILVILIIIINYLRDDTVKSETEIEQRFPLPVLGVVPDMTSPNSDSDYYYYADKNTSAENEKGAET